MKKIVLILIMLVISTLGIYSYSNINEPIINYSEISTIKIQVPSILKIVETTDTAYININTYQDFDEELIYVIDDSTLNIKMNSNIFYNWDINDINCKDIRIRIGIPDNTKIKIESTPNLIISNYKNTKLSNYEQD